MTYVSLSRLQVFLYQASYTEKKELLKARDLVNKWTTSLCKRTNYVSEAPTTPSSVPERDFLIQISKCISRIERIYNIEWYAIYLSPTFIIISTLSDQNRQCCKNKLAHKCCLMHSQLTKFHLVSLSLDLLVTKLLSKKLWCLKVGFMDTMENFKIYEQSRYTLCFKVIKNIMTGSCTDTTLNADTVQIYHPKWPTLNDRMVYVSKLSTSIFRASIEMSI